MLSDEFVALVARRFAALSEPMRIKLLDALHVGGETSVTDLAATLGATHANVSKHLNMLFAEGIVSRRKQQTKFLYRVRPILNPYGG